MFAVQEGISASKSDPSAKAFLVQLMDQLEVVSHWQELLVDRWYCALFTSMTR